MSQFSHILQFITIRDNHTCHILVAYCNKFQFVTLLRFVILSVPTTLSTLHGQPSSDLQEHAHWLAQSQLSRANRGGRDERSNAYNVRILEDQSSPLGQQLLDDFGFGILGGLQALKYATLAVQEGARGKLLHGISELTTVDRRVSSFLFAYFTEHYPFAMSPANVNIPLFVHKGKPDNIGVQLLPHYYLPPHRWLHYLYNNFRTHFFNAMVGSPSAITDFWQGVHRSDPKWLNLLEHIRNHPCLLSKGIPIMLHGHGVPCSNQS